MSALVDTRTQDEPHIVYVLRDATDEVLYVGCTYDLTRRIREHSRGKDWFASVVSTETEIFPNMDEAIQHEKHLIRQLKPRHNNMRYPTTAEIHDGATFSVQVSHSEAAILRSLARELGIYLTKGVNAKQEGNVRRLLKMFVAACENSPEEIKLLLTNPGPAKGTPPSQGGRPRTRPTDGTGG